MKWLEMAERIPDYEETEFQLSGRSYSKAQKALRRQLQQLRSEGEYPDSKLLSHCATSGMLSEVLEVLESMRSAGVQVPFASNEAALQACVPLGKWQQALSMLEDYWATDSVNPDRALGLVLRACRRFGAWAAALQFLDLARNEALSVDSWAYAGAMGACLEPSRSRITAAEDAMTLYREFTSTGAPTGWGFWITAACACEEGLLWENAVEILSSTPPSAMEKVHLCVLRTCAQVAQWQKAVELLGAFTGDGVSLMTAYCATIMACQREECWEQATSLLEEAKELEFAMAESARDKERPG